MTRCSNSRFNRGIECQLSNRVFVCVISTSKVEYLNFERTASSSVSGLVSWLTDTDNHIVFGFGTVVPFTVKVHNSLVLFNRGGHISGSTSSRNNSTVLYT